MKLGAEVESDSGIVEDAVLLGLNEGEGVTLGVLEPETYTEIVVFLEVDLLTESIFPLRQ